MRVNMMSNPQRTGLQKCCCEPADGLSGYAVREEQKGNQALIRSDLLQM